MKVLHVIPSLSPKHGGPSIALPMIARALVDAGLQVDVATTDDDGPGVKLEVPLGVRLQADGFGRFYFRKQTEFYKCSWTFRNWMMAHVQDYDVVHVHALFSFTSICAARQADRRKVPYVIRPLGVLNRWGMKNRRQVIKSLSFRFIERPILRRAAAMHYTSHAEKLEAERTGATARAVVIPLGIDVAEFAKLPGPEIFLKRWPQTAGRVIVLFLSRLDPKKGLNLLLPVFAEVKLRHPRVMLVVAGSGEEHYVDKLRQEAVRLDLQDDVVWPGFLIGAEKLSAFAAATIYVLPSYSENFGIALVEALAAGLPCLTTDGVAVSADMREFDAGLVVPCEAAPLASGLERLLDSEVLRSRLGTNARRLATQKFSIEVMGMALKKLYEKIVSEQKSCVA